MAHVSVFRPGPGGTFYNTLDVTLDDIATRVAEDSTNDGALLDVLLDQPTASSGSGASRVTRVSTRLTRSRRTVSCWTGAAIDDRADVGETWSDPAIGQVQDEDGPYVMVVGSDS